MKPQRFYSWSRPICAALALAAMLPTASAFADENMTLAVSGALRSQSGGPVADGKYILFVRIYAEANATKPMWEDVLTNVELRGGMFAVQLGAGKPLPTTTFTTPKPRFIGVAVGNDPELPRVPLTAVPTAAYAYIAAGLECVGCVKALQTGFTYAGSTTKGGAADSALTAKEADHAKQADHATNADHATLAEQATLANRAALADKATFAELAGSAASAKNATNAEVAQSALGLKCTGCIGLSAFDKTAKDAFVSSKGGSIAGSLYVDNTVTVGKTLALGDALIDGGRFAVGDRKNIACNANKLGRVLLDATTKRLYMCDGTAFMRISMCSEDCRTAKETTCGEPVTNGCGDAAGCSGKGTLCANGLPCTGGKCGNVGDTEQLPAASCKAAKTANGAAKSGLFWLNPGGGAAFQAYCDMETDGGGWTLVLRVSKYDGGIDFTHDGSGWGKSSYNKITDLTLSNLQGTKDLVSPAYASLTALDVMVRERLGADYKHSVRTKTGFMGATTLQAVLSPGIVKGGRKCSNGLVYMGGSPQHPGYTFLVLNGDENGDSEPAKIGIRNKCDGDSETLQIGYTRSSHGDNEVYTQSNQWPGLASVYVFVR